MQHWNTINIFTLASDLRKSERMEKQTACNTPDIREKKKQKVLFFQYKCFAGCRLLRWLLMTLQCNFLRLKTSFKCGFILLCKKSSTYCSSTAHNQIMLIAGCGLGLAQVTQIQFGGIHIMFHFRDITFYWDGLSSRTWSQCVQDCLIKGKIHHCAT